MSDELDIKLGPPQNEEYRALLNEINSSFDRLNEMATLLPTPKDLVSLDEISLSDSLNEAYKELRQYEQDFGGLLQRAIDFRGNPTLDFKPDVDVYLSYRHYLDLFSSRIDSLERSYYRHVEKVQRIEDFINKHNNKLKADRSLSYGRRSIWLGIAGILLGILGSSFSFFQSQSTSKNEQIHEIKAPVLTDSLTIDSSSTNAPKIEEAEVDTFNTEN